MTIAPKMPSASGYGTLERPRYTPGLLLEDEDLTSGVSYTRRLTQMMFNALFGCGVICGLEVSGTPTCGNRRLQVTIEKGLGLDCMGNPIEVPTRQVFEFDPGCEEFPSELWVAACYSEKSCAPRELSCSYDGGSDRTMTRYRQGFEINLYAKQPHHACACTKPDENAPSASGSCCPPAGEERQATAVAQRDVAAAPAPAAEPDNAVPRLDGCYAEHMQGVCSCGCGCNCIVIGRLALTLTGNRQLVEKADSDYAPVRRIRPMLIGQWPRPQATR